MKIKNYLFAKAGIAFLCCTACCAFLNYMTFVTFQPMVSGKESLKVWMFILYVIQAATAVMTIVYGDYLVKHRRLGWKWHGMDELPVPEDGHEKVEVVFVTIDGCLFNGNYYQKEKVFRGYDGLDFKQDEILAWSTSQFLVQVKDDCYFPDGSLCEKNKGIC